MELLLFIPFGFFFIIVLMSIFFMSIFYINKYSNNSEKGKNYKPYEENTNRNADYKVYNVQMLRESKSNSIVVPDEVSEKESSTRSTQEEECKVYKRPVNRHSEEIERNLNNEKSTKNETNNSETRNKNNESNNSTRNNDFEDGPIKENKGILSDLFGDKPDEL